MSNWMTASGRETSGLGRWARMAVLAAWCVAAAPTVGCSRKPAPARTPEAPRPSASLRSSAADRRHVAVTVYNQNFALVREERLLRLGTGRVALAYEDVSAHIQPSTVHVRPLGDPNALVVLEQNYRYDLLTPENLLEKYVGRRVQVVRHRERGGEDQVQEAEVLAANGGVVLRIDGQIVTAMPDRFVFPELPPDLLPKPTLVWLLDSAAPEQRVEVSYLTQNLSWRADYVLVLAADETRADLSGWVTLDNRSGTSFHDAELDLVAGDVQRLAPAPPPAPEAYDMVAKRAPGAPPAFRQEALFEYHLYGLQRPTDLLDKEQKQVSLLDAAGVAVRKKLVLEPPAPLFQSRLPEPLRDQRPAVVLVLDNRQASGLGLPLPAGVVRVYKADQSGAQQFVGEDAIEHTPRDEEVEILLGRAFDVVAERRQLAWRSLGRCAAESDWHIEVRNHKATAALVEVVEPAHGDWELTRHDHPPTRRDANGFSFELNVPPNGATTLTFSVRARWC